MRRLDDDKVKRAREVIAGRRGFRPDDLCALANDLCEMNDFGHARRIYAIALGLAPAQARSGIEIRLAFATCKDPDLPLSDRLDRAEALLTGLTHRSAGLSPAQNQAILTLLGDVNKQRWFAYGRRGRLHAAMSWYRAAADFGLETDLGYAAINLAFTLELLAALSDPRRGGVPGYRDEAAQIRNQIRESLPEVVRRDPSRRGWEVDCTLGEACVGLHRYQEARDYMRRAAAERPGNWRLEPVARQIAEIVRMQAKADEIPPERLAEAPGFAVLEDLLGGSSAASAFSLGKVGLALSGGGFRASIYHIGVLARLAELDVLRRVEVISCVSGGSIVGAYYYLELRNLLQTKTDSEITREDYIQIVRNMETGFLAGVRRNLRTRMLLEPGSNWKALTGRNCTTTDRLGDLFERELYSRIDDERHGASERYLQDLLVTPAGLPAGTRFDPRYDNWRREHKVPILVLNATSLNTCHNWQFTATFMGEPPARGVDGKIDGNGRLRRMYYRDAPEPYRRIRLGRAVAASACVPGLFDPVALDGLYQQDYVAELVDGGVYDNQGASGLLEQDCTVLLVSDAAGQTAAEKRPANGRIAVALRSTSILQARCRQEQYELLTSLEEAGLLRGFAYVHLKKGLEAEPVDWLGCPDPSAPAPAAVLTSYGIRKDVQAALASIRTDLDAFSDVEADALMLSGYRMMSEEFEKGIAGFPASSGSEEWRFRRIEKLVSNPNASRQLDLLKEALGIARFTAFKALRISRGLQAGAAVAVAAAAAGCWRLMPVRFELWMAVTAALSVAGLNWLLRRVSRNPNPLSQILMSLPLLIAGGPLVAFATRVVDPIYIRFGRPKREDAKRGGIRDANRTGYLTRQKANTD